MYNEIKELSKYNAINDPKNPLDSMSEPELSKILKKFQDDIRELFSKS